MSLTDEDKNWIAAQLTINATAAKAANEELRTSLTAAIERVETSLLTEFHKWAGPRPGATTECALTRSAAGM
jgi:hypothetical protein